MESGFAALNEDWRSRTNLIGRRRLPSKLLRWTEFLNRFQSSTGPGLRNGSAGWRAPGKSASSPGRTTQPELDTHNSGRLRRSSLTRVDAPHLYSTWSGERVGRAGGLRLTAIRAGDWAISCPLPSHDYAEKYKMDVERRCRSAATMGMDDVGSTLHVVML